MQAFLYLHTHTHAHTHAHTHKHTHTHACTHTHTHTDGAGHDYSQKGCCWKAFHTDVNGKWYKPHKAGPVTAILLVIGWILFLVLFGWIVGLALILVVILICFAYIFNFMCTGRCKVEEIEESQPVSATNSRQPQSSASRNRQNRGARV